MKVAILSESPADEAAVRILVEAILGEPIETVTLRVRSGGWNAVLRAIPPTLRALHFRNMADAMVVVIDSDQSTVHEADHNLDDPEAAKCRSCQLVSIIEKIQRDLRPMPDWPSIKTAIAVPTPSIEAWYLFGMNSDCTEAGWKVKQKSRVSSVSAIRQLKTEAYGTDRPGIQLETSCAIIHAQRLAGNLVEFEKYFPNSFQLLANELRAWIPKDAG